MNLQNLTEIIGLVQGLAVMSDAHFYPTLMFAFYGVSVWGFVRLASIIAMAFRPQSGAPRGRRRSRNHRAR
ncbi:hypothetical protein [Novacetimonas sp. GS1]|uniref:hypothetical protein n=1 Tax=Novacetimonas sp. GS1 TaxID=3119990 RepID=UPI002FCCE535